MEERIKGQITKRKFYRTAALDPRCKILLLIMVGSVSYFVNSDVAGIALIMGGALFISVGNGAKRAIKMVLIYIVVAYLNAFLRYVSIPMLSVLMSVFGVTILKIIPIVMIGLWVLDTTYMDDLMVSLQRMKFPQSVTIPLVVMFRYIPTLRVEYRMIRNTMNIRGINDTFGARVLHPVSTIEYILIPLLMRCLKVTDELAASGITRGLELEKRRYALNLIYYSWKEWCVTFGVTMFLGSLLFFEHIDVGKIVLWRI